MLDCTLSKAGNLSSESSHPKPQYCFTLTLLSTTTQRWKYLKLFLLLQGLKVLAYFFMSLNCGTSLASSSLNQFTYFTKEAKLSSNGLVKILMIYQKPLNWPAPSQTFPNKIFFYYTNIYSTGLKVPLRKKKNVFIG